METIKQAKSYLRENFDKGTECPCCGQLVKRYARLFDSGLARFAIALYHLSDGKPKKAFDKNEIRKLAGLKNLSATNYGIIRYWKILEPLPVEVSEKRTSGMWQLTDLGIQFVESKIAIPKYCYTYNNSIDGYSEQRIKIEQALGLKFNYKELMNYGLNRESHT